MTIQNPTQVAIDRQSGPLDWLLVIAAIWLFISPWALGFSGAVTGNVAANGAGVAAGAAPPGPAVDISRAAWNAWILGAIVFMVALAQAISFTPERFQQKWVNVVFGAWIFAAPWALGFTVLPRASWDHWVIGAIVFVLGIARYAQSRSVDVPLASEPGLPPMSDPTISPLMNEPGIAPPLTDPDLPGGEQQPRPAGNINTPREGRTAGGRR